MAKNAIDLLLSIGLNMAVVDHKSKKLLVMKITAKKMMKKY
jgi:hypothetical protein